MTLDHVTYAVLAVTLGALTMMGFTFLLRVKDGKGLGAALLLLVGFFAFLTFVR